MVARERASTTHPMASTRASGPQPKRSHGAADQAGVLTLQIDLSNVLAPASHDVSSCSVTSETPAAYSRVGSQFYSLISYPIDLVE